MSSPKMKLLAKVIGESSVKRLIERFGGTSIYVPPTKVKKIQPFGQLARTIGIENAEKVSARWGGRPLYIPNESRGNPPQILVELRRRLVLDLHNRGVENKDIARGLNLTIPSVRKIIKGE